MVDYVLDVSQKDIYQDLDEFIKSCQSGRLYEKRF